MRARAHLAQTALFTWQELRERVFRIVRSKGAPEATLDEKAVPRTHPNVLLLLTLDGVDAVAQADWGCQSAGFKSKVLAWVVASAISPAPDPAIAEGEAKRLMQQAKQVRIDLARAGNDEKKVAAIREPGHAHYSNLRCFAAAVAMMTAGAQAMRMAATATVYLSTTTTTCGTGVCCCHASLA